MPRPGVYKRCKCRACDLKFFTQPFHSHKPVYCPKCGDDMDVEKHCNVKIQNHYIVPNWGEGEDRILIEGMNTGESYKEIAGKLPGRTAGGVMKRANKLRKKGLIY